MIKPADPRELAIDLLPRSICSIKVAAVITDSTGRIISWGWNHAGPDGMGQHAEHHAILRANKERISEAIIFVAGIYERGTLVNAKPCSTCQARIRKYRMIINYRDKQGTWQVI